MSHRLAAWNERRLLRDLYDCAFLSERAGATPDAEVLEARLSRVESRLPGLKRRRTTSLAEMAAELRHPVVNLSDEDFEREQSGVLPADERAGVALRIRTSAVKLADGLERR